MVDAVIIYVDLKNILVSWGETINFILYLS